MLALLIRQVAPLALLAVSLAGCETTGRAAAPVQSVAVVEDDTAGTSKINIASLTEVIQRNPADPSACAAKRTQVSLRARAAFAEGVTNALYRSPARSHQRLQKVSSSALNPGTLRSANASRPSRSGGSK